MPWTVTLTAASPSKAIPKVPLLTTLASSACLPPSLHAAWLHWLPSPSCLLLSLTWPPFGIHPEDGPVSYFSAAFTSSNKLSPTCPLFLLPVLAPPWELQQPLPLLAVWVLRPLRRPRNHAWAQVLQQSPQPCPGILRASLAHSLPGPCSCPRLPHCPQNLQLTFEISRLPPC